MGIIERAIGGGRTLTTNYTFVSPPKRVQVRAPFLETVHAEAPFEMEMVHPGIEKGALDGGKPCTAVHPNIENKGNTDGRLTEEV